MYWNRSSGDILVEWQDEVETQLEAGTAPLLDMGASHWVLEGAASLLALQLLAARRNDVTRPVVIAGGNSPLWLGALFHPTPHTRPSLSPDLKVVYAGADPATYMATLGVHAAGLRARFAGDSTATPLEVRWLLAPKMAPGRPAPWEALPFLEIGEQPRVPLPAVPPEPDPTTDWIAWSVLLLAVFLILFAMLV
jgi:hypothetical protein